MKLGIYKSGYILDTKCGLNSLFITTLFSVQKAPEMPVIC